MDVNISTAKSDLKGKALDWDEILTRLTGFATSSRGQESLANLKPLAHPQAAQESCAQIQEAMNILLQGQRPFMESLDLFPIWHQRLSKEAVLKPLELKDVRHFCIETLALAEILTPIFSPWLSRIKEQLLPASEPLAAIDQIMTPDGEIRSDASELLYKLFREKSQQVKQAQNILDRLIHQHEMEPVLQDRYVTNREGRWVLPVKSGMQHQFDGIIHAASQSKQTVFMEPKELIPINNRLREIEVDIENEVEQLLTDLSHYLSELREEFAQTHRLMLECDIRLAQAQLSQHLSAQACKFSKDKIFLKNVRHPLLTLNNENVVTNTVKLDEHKRILLLSGPNAGGKTVLLKSIGLAAHMARCGLPICAEAGSCLPFFSHIHISIGDSQSIDSHLSTFAAHLKILGQATQAEGPQQLILIDEICGSTDPEEGTALARSFIESYLESGSFGIITSHLGPLKMGWNPNCGLVNGSLEYDSQSGQPTYQFMMGIPGQSLALKTAQRVGISEKILKRAFDHLNPDIKNYQTSLQEIEVLKEEIGKLKVSLLKQEKDLSREKRHYQELIDKLEREKEVLLQKALQRAEQKLDALIEHSKVDDIFKKHENLAKLKSQLPEVVKSSKSKTHTFHQVTSKEEFVRIYPPGSRVFAPSIGKDGVVQGQPNAKGEVPLLSNSMRLLVPWDQLRPPHQAVNPTKDVLRTHPSATSLSPSDADPVVDLRGYKVDEALTHLEQQLDSAVAHNQGRLKIIHGHGTDTLKRALRNYLSRSTYVQKWKAGTANTGGDGITWVELN